jgi:hypothetical protein
MTSFLKRALAIFLIVGIGVSPLYAVAMKGMDQSAQASSMANMADMPCHPDKSPSHNAPTDKACPFMVACLSLCFQGMPPVSGIIVVPATVELKTTYENVQRLTSLTPSPPARPPRA